MKHTWNVFIVVLSTVGYLKCLNLCSEICLLCIFGSITADERQQLRNMYPYLREEYKKYHNLTDKEVLEREYVYDCYVYEEEVRSIKTENTLIGLL